MLISVSRIWIGFFLLIPFYLSSQNVQRCHHEEKMEQAFLLDPTYKKAINHDYNNENTIPKNKALQSLITIPVHIIILHPPGQAIGTGVNFSIDHIQSQIDVLNLDFRRLNADAGNTPSQFSAADVEIEFCLASIDPNGNPTNGVTRFGTNLSLNNNENTIKSQTGWNRDSYMNFWVGDNLEGILGWAYLPNSNSLPNSVLDGVVVASCTFGGPGFGTCSPYNLGRTATHEVGHYLGLRHIWGDGGCNNDDNIGDTPIQSGSNFGCPSHPNPSCNNGGDMFMNYMDYVNDNCMNAFTSGQGASMQNILNTSRSSLLTAANTVCNSANNTPLAISLQSQSNVLCNGDNTGSATVQGGGGSGNYSYLINGGAPQSSNTFTGLAAGNYTILMVDGSSSVSIQVTILEPTPLIPIINNQINLSCNGNTNGSILVSAIGGSDLSGNGYQFSIDNNPFTGNNFFNNLSGGIHELAVIDENNCLTSTQFFISEPAPLTSIVSSLVPIECAGGSNATITLESQGGTPPFQYDLNNGGFSPNNAFTNLSAGDYTASTIDFNQCQHSFNFSIEQAIPIEPEIISQTNTPCFGQNGGEINITASGGNGNLNYVLGNDSNSTGFFSNLAAGNYNISITDENNCSESINFNILEPTDIIANISEQQNVSCFNENNGSLQIVADGGSGNFQFILGNEINSTGTFSNLSAGNYIVEILDNNNCSKIINAEINQPAELLTSISNQQNINCFGESNGAVQFAASGGTGTLQFSLQNETNFTGTFNNLSAGNYAVLISDENNCSQTIDFEISQPTELIASISNQQNVICFGESNGQISIQVNGGSGGNTFTLNGNSNTTGDFSNLQAGNYEVIISDLNNCSTSTLFTITEPSDLNLSIENIMQAPCAGQQGTIVVAADGGSGNYQYSIGNISNTSGVFENLAAGNYNIQLTDGNNCSEFADFIIEEPASINTSITQIQSVNCYGENSGDAQIAASGGTGTLQFSLQNETNLTGTFNNLFAGNYAVLISDENNCTQTINFEISQPTGLIASISNQQNVICFGESNGQISVQVNGGNGGNTFTLNGNSNTTGDFSNLQAGDYEMQINDENGCFTSLDFNISQPEELTISLENINQAPCSGQEGTIEVSANGGIGNLIFSLENSSNNSGIFNSLSGGNYEVQVTDGNNCTASILVDINEPASLNTSISNIQSISCNGENNGSVQINASGGVGNLTFTLGNESNSSGFFENLSAGSYSVITTDDNNCTSTIDVFINEPNIIEINLTSFSEVSCYNISDGEINISGTGGTGALIYTLGNQSNSTGFFDELSAGDYSILAEDANGCISMIEITVGSPDILSGQIETVSHNSCNGNKEGSVQLFATGGTETYSYSIGSSSNTSGYFDNLPVGIYNFTVTDNNGCISNGEFEILEPEAITFNLQQNQNLLCNGDQSGIIQVNATGGIGILSYSLGNETNNTGLFNNLDVGEYIVIAIDENSCSKEIEIEITEPSPIEVSIQNNNNVDCFGENSGSVNLTSSGGTGLLSYTIGNETNTSGTFENLNAGSYDAIVFDENNCFTNISFEMYEPNQLVSDIVELMPILCCGTSSAIIQVTSIGGSGIFSYSLGTNTNSTGIFENLSAGTYEITTTDGNNCTTFTTITIEEPTEIVIEILNNSPAGCAGAPTGSTSIQALNGAGNFTYSLNNETNTTGVFENLSSGIYDVMIQDDNGCVLLETITISEENDINIENSSAVNVHCNGFQDGEIHIEASSSSGDLSFDLNGMINNSGYFENLPAGNYNVIVSDLNNCSSILSFEIMEPAALNLEAQNITNPLCFGESSGSIMLSTTGGNEFFTYTLNNETNSTGIFENLSAGTYEALVTDNLGCFQSQTFEITEPNQLNINTINLTPDAGNGEGSVTLEGTGGTPPLTYSLDNSNYQDENLFINLAMGEYEGFVLDGNGCISSTTFTIDFETSISNQDIGINQIEVTPNPFSNYLFININLANAQELQLDLWTILGQNISHKILNLASGQHHLTIDTYSDMPAGTYFLQIKNNIGEVGYFKLIKQ